MKNGADWYKREPTEYLADTQGLTAKEHAVFSIVIDLIYSHGGSINNDPSWVAGWIKDMGSAAVRKVLSSLSESGKLIVSETEITQERAKTEAKTKQNLRETAAENGRKGGKKTSELRSESNKTSDLGEAVATNGDPADKTRLDKTREVDKSTSSQEVADYQRFMDAHPKPIESDDGEKAFRSLIDAGEDVEQIIASAKKYSETVKSWSDKGRVQQSDNFLSDDRGRWRDYTPKQKKPAPSYQDKLKFWANSINGDKFIPKASVNQKLAFDMIKAGLVSPEKMKERGIAS